MLERGIPRSEYEVFDLTEKPIGKITSGTQSPSLQCGIGLAYIEKENAKFDHNVLIKIRNKFVFAKIVNPPFLKPTI